MLISRKECQCQFEAAAWGQRGLCMMFGEQGWRSGDRARLPPMCPRFDSRTRRHTAV